MTEARSRLAEALTSSSPFASALVLVRTLRDEGMGQAAIYRLFSEQQQRVPGDDPRYDAVVDTMDLIWGGPWAKGHALFDEELSSDRIERE